MDATTLTPDAPLPTDVPTLQAMVRELFTELQRLRAENAELKTKLDAALKHRFGRRSERRTPPSAPASQKPPPRRDDHGRSPLPEYLERRVVVHDLTEAEKLCPCCGQSRVCIGDRVKHVCRVAHARRKFVAATDSGDDRAAVALELIGRLYAVERALPPLLPPSNHPVQREHRRQREEQRRALRQRDAEPVWDELSKWLGEQKPRALPKSPLGNAIGYASNNWGALKRYLEQGFLAIDNNLSERTLRAIALGRNAWGVIGSAVGGTTAAVLYSIVGTCRHLGIDPFGYLRDTLPGMFALGERPTPERLLDWLPDRWQLHRGRDTPDQIGAAGS